MARITRVFQKGLAAFLQKHHPDQEVNIITLRDEVFNGYIIRSDQQQLVLKNKILTKIPIILSDIREINYRTTD